MSTVTHHSTHNLRGSDAQALVSIGQSAGSIVSGIRGLLSTWRQRQLQRERLATLDAHLLRDIGRTRLEAKLEARKPFWLA